MTKTTKSGAQDARSQLSLPLPETPPRYDREAFVIAEPNQAAWRAVEGWLGSNEPALIICGPAGSGKTHLASILANEAGGSFCNIAEWRGAPEGARLIVLDNLPAGDPHHFLAVLEDLAAQGRRVVLVGAGHPGEWSGDLKDLRTRLEAAPRASLGEPDEALIRRVMVKGFRDRQLEVSAAVIEYAAPRLARTFAAAQAFVALADRAALAEKRKISTALAQKIIDDLSESGPAA